jgi:fructose-1,6-bisphosphatase II
MVRIEGQCACARFASITEAAAMAAADWIGRGDGLAGGLAAGEAMAAELARVPFRARVVAGRGGNENFSALRVGDEVGSGWGPQPADGGGAGGEVEGDVLWELAVEPLEGHRPLARGSGGAMAMLAVGPPGSIMAVPEMYMQKMIVAGQASSAIDIEASVADNVRAVAAVLGRGHRDLSVVVLDRARHEELIAQVRDSGARLKLIDDGDVSAGIAAAVRDSGVDMCVGIGGSTQGIITAAALRCLGGEMQARFWPVSRHQVEQIKASGIEDVEARLTTSDMAGEGVLFAATAVTGGRFLRGIDLRTDGARTETLVLCSRCHAVRVVKTIHRSENRGPQVRLETR